ELLCSSSEVQRHLAAQRMADHATERPPLGLRLRDVKRQPRQVVRTTVQRVRCGSWITISVGSQIDQHEASVGPPLVELLDEAAKILSRAQGTVQHERRPLY